MVEQLKTEQMKEWGSEFGKDYTDRNPHTPEEMDALYTRAFGIPRSQLNKEFLGDLDRSIRILEVGCNVGAQLQALQKLGFTNLYGIELQHYAVELAKSKTKNINILQGSAFDLPFKDGYFDLVYTSGVLIHISPNEIGKAVDEILRCSNRYVWGFEYYADSYTEVPYRGKTGLLWKTDFAKLFTDRGQLRTLKERKLKYLDSENVDKMYLLSK